MLYPLTNELDVCDEVVLTYTYDATPVYKLLANCNPDNFTVISKCLENHLYQLYNCTEYEDFLKIIGDDLIEYFYYAIYGDGTTDALEDNSTFDEGDREQQLLSNLSDDLNEFYHEIGGPLREGIEESILSETLDLQQFSITRQQRLGNSQFFVFTLSGTKMKAKIKDYIDFLVNKANS